MHFLYLREVQEGHVLIDLVEMELVLLLHEVDGDVGLNWQGGVQGDVDGWAALHQGSVDAQLEDGVDQDPVGNQQISLVFIGCKLRYLMLDMDWTSPS